MNTITITDSSNNDQAVAQIVSYFQRKGNVLLLPTETVYGLMCKWGDSEAIQKIFDIKKRDHSKLLQMLISDVSMLTEIGCKLDDRVEKVVKAFCPGPITIIIKGKETTIGFRIPDHQLILKIIRKMGSPLAATSANISGGENFLTVQEAIDCFTTLPELAVDAGTISSDSTASTVVDMTSNNIRILRPGPISEEDILRVLK